MGRLRERHDEDRYLTLRAGNYLYKRRVPLDLVGVDARAPHVRISLKTKDPALARRKRDQLEAADDALWDSMTSEGITDPARRRYEAAVKRVEALDFSFYTSSALGNEATVQAFVDRFRAVMSGHTGDALVEPLLGLVPTPKTTVTQAFDLYCDEIVADELTGKSETQRAQWKKVKQRAVSNFVRLVADRPMDEITIEDAKKVYRYWLGRIAPKKGDPAPTASASSGNRDLGNMRVLYDSYFKHMGETGRKNPFDGLGFSTRNKKSRPPIPTEWLRDRLLKGDALTGMNDEARGILLIMVETGARPSEIANLLPSAIRLTHKVPHIVIEPSLDPSDPREIKTLSSQRSVPLLGVALAAAERHPGGFPRYRHRENDLSAALNKYFRENKLFPSSAHKIYSIRHSFEDRMKEAGIDDELRRILMGHSIDRPRYGSGGSLEWRRDELSRLVLPFDRSVV